MKALGLILAAASLAFFILATAATALAQDPRAQRRRNDSDPVTTYDFVDGSNVDGSRPGPMETYLQGRRRRARASLIVPRVHFIPEMLKTVESM